MMDERERLRLTRLYAQMSDEEVIEVLLEDEKEYERNPYEAYELMRNEARRREIDGQVETRKKEGLDIEKQYRTDVEIDVVYAGSVTDAGLAKNILEMNGLTAFLWDEALGTIAPPYVSPLLKGAVKVVVEKKFGEQARAILDEYVDNKRG